MSIPMATHKWAETYPELGTAPVPAEPCISADYFEREREAIFRRTWLNIGRVEDVPSPGSYIVKDLPVPFEDICNRDSRQRGDHTCLS